MFKAWRRFWDDFLNNEAYFIARVRALTLGVAVGGLGFAHDFADALGKPGVERPIKVIAVVAGAVGGLMRAGDKTTPERVQAAIDAGKPQA